MSWGPWPGVRGGSGGPPNPDAGNTDMILNNDAQASGITIVGGQVTNWPDQSTYGNHANATENFGGHTLLWPTFNAAGINGFPSITVGNDETKMIGRINADIPAPNWLTSTHTWTAILVGKSNGPNGPMIWIPGFDGIVGPSIAIGGYNQGGQQNLVPSFTGGFTRVPFLDGVNDYVNFPVIIAVRSSADVVTAWVNGTQRPIGPLIGSDLVAFRSYIYGNNGGDGTVTEVGEGRFYKVAMTDAQILQRVSYLSQKWNIALTPGTSSLGPQVVAYYTPAADDLLSTGLRTFNTPFVTDGRKFYVLRQGVYVQQYNASPGPVSGAMLANLQINGTPCDPGTTDWGDVVTFNGATFGTNGFNLAAPAALTPGGLDLSAHQLQLNLSRVWSGFTSAFGRWVVEGFWA